MDTIAEIFESTAYFMLNPIAWLAATAFALRSGVLRKPIIAAVATQLAICVLLIALVALSNRPFPAHHVFFLLLIPGTLSGLLISAPVLLITKRRRLKRFLSSRLSSSVDYQKRAEHTL